MKCPRCGERMRHLVTIPIDTITPQLRLVTYICPKCGYICGYWNTYFTISNSSTLPTNTTTDEDY